MKLSDDLSAMRVRAAIASAAHTLATSDVDESLDRSRIKLGSYLSGLAGHHLAEAGDDADGWSRYWWVDDLLIESVVKHEKRIEVAGGLICGDDLQRQWTEPAACSIAYEDGDVTLLRFQVGDAALGPRRGHKPSWRRRPQPISEWWFEFTVRGSPRDLTSGERTALDFMLRGDAPWLEPLRQQAANAHVVGMCGCGCPTINLGFERVPDQRAVGVGSGVVLTSFATDAPNELMVFADDGWLSSLEFVSHDGDPPREFPPIDSFGQPEPWGPPTTP